ncbi:MAG TPA: NosD domain-containing protein [Polyangia bacterium]|nr:NosD domain-containing protein [Polyangia bacterium]
MYVDRPAERELKRQSADPVVPGDHGVDFRAAVALSDLGQILHSHLSDQRFCTTPDPARPPLQVPAEYPTIQQAIDAAEPGDIVSVGPGTYHEHLVLRTGVRLVGAGAWRTTLDGAGQAISLIDYTGARDALVSGFTLRGAGPAQGCAQPGDPFLCSGNWYAAAIYGDGHSQFETACGDSSVVITQNVFRDNYIAVMAYFHARAVVRNNVFASNEFGFVANHLQDHALIMNNTFIDNRRLAVGSSAAYLDIFGNIIAGSAVAITHEFIQTGRIACNAFIANGMVGERVPIGRDGNITADQAFVSPGTGDYRPAPQLIDALSACLVDPAPGIDDPPPVIDWLRPEPGAFGGALGLWSASPPKP